MPRRTLSRFACWRMNFNLSKKTVAETNPQMVMRILDTHDRMFSMSQKRLVAAIDQRFRSLSRRDRIAKIRELAGESPDDDRFVQKTFPELYREAFQTTRRGAGVRSGVARKRARAGALRSR